MKAVTAEEMREIDRAAIEERGVPGLTLMERAGRAVAAAAIERFAPKSAIVLAGKGNNGGDGFVAARYLAREGVSCRIEMFCTQKELQGDALEMFRHLPESVETRLREGVEGLAEEIGQHDLAIDALLGTGIRGAVRGPMGEAIKAINAARAAVLAVDIPSGLPADGGTPEGPCVRAGATVTMGLPKIGMLIHPGASLAGDLIVADLGFPRDLMESDALRVEIDSMAGIGAMLPFRPADGNKGTFGKPLILAGSAGMTGAAVLAARAAGRSGAGLVLCAVPKGLETVFDCLLIEAVKPHVPSSAAGRFDAASIDSALELAKGADAVLLGPGLSQAPGVAEFVAAIVERCPLPLILDADGLNALGTEPEILRRRPGPTVVTPHPGEMARLIGVSAAEVQKDRLRVARDFARRYGVVAVLKGARTILAVPDGRIGINITGNAGLAKGGSGDVLAGLLAGLAAQGLDLARAARVGVFLHGLAGDLASKRLGERAMTPSDVIDSLGEAFLAVERAAREGASRSGPNYDKETPLVYVYPAAAD